VSNITLAPPQKSPSRVIEYASEHVRAAFCAKLFSVHHHDVLSTCRQKSARCSVYKNGFMHTMFLAHSHTPKPNGKFGRMQRMVDSPETPRSFRTYTSDMHKTYASRIYLSYNDDFITKFRRSSSRMESNDGRPYRQILFLECRSLDRSAHL
jgi:hypothetical protein